MSAQFTYNLDDLLDLVQTKKGNLVRYVLKHFKENVHFVRRSDPSSQGRGGHNRVAFMLTEQAYSLVEASYGQQHHYKSGGVNTLMSLENQTIGFMKSALDGIYPMVRQYKIGSYYVDLFLSESGIIVECDEFGHSDRNVQYEKKREEYLLEKGYRMLRFNPNAPGFDLSIVIHVLLKMVHGKLTSNLVCM